jgi:hypothetical protein
MKRISSLGLATNSAVTIGVMRVTEERKQADATAQLRGLIHTVERGMKDK